MQGKLQLERTFKSARLGTFLRVVELAQQREAIRRRATIRSSIRRRPIRLSDIRSPDLTNTMQKGHRNGSR